MSLGEVTRRESLLAIVAGYTAAALILVATLIGTILLPDIIYPF